MPTLDWYDKQGAVAEAWKVLSGQKTIRLSYHRGHESKDSKTGEKGT